MTHRTTISMCLWIRQTYTVLYFFRCICDSIFLRSSPQRRRRTGRCWILRAAPLRRAVLPAAVPQLLYHQGYTEGQVWLRQNIIKTKTRLFHFSISSAQGGTGDREIRPKTEKSRSRRQRQRRRQRQCRSSAFVRNRGKILISNSGSVGNVEKLKLTNSGSAGGAGENFFITLSAKQRGKKAPSVPPCLRDL